MDNSKYLIIGGGMTADSAVSGIREIDSIGDILVISEEENSPYNRPPLSKALWKGKGIDSIWRKTSEKNARLLLGKKVQSINPERREVKDSTDQIFTFDKLLIATGGRPRKLPFGGGDIIYYRTLEDFKRLYSLSLSKKRFAVIGSGFIGSEISAALALNKCGVTLFDIGHGIGWNIFPAEMTGFINQYYQDKGVEIIANAKVRDVTKKGTSFVITLGNGLVHEADVVVAGIGIQPNIKIAREAGLLTENGISVNEYLQTSAENIYAAGDVANFYNPLLQERIRVEHADNANMMGKLAGRNMAGAGEIYDYLPFFYSDLFDMGYEAVGELDSNSEIVQDWQEKYEKGVLYYLKNSRVRGVLLWNVWDKVNEAREVIGDRSAVDRSGLISRIR